MVWFAKTPSDFKTNKISYGEVVTRMKSGGALGAGYSVGAPRIHGELLELGFDLSERSVSSSV